MVAHPLRHRGVLRCVPSSLALAARDQTRPQRRRSHQAAGSPAHKRSRHDLYRWSGQLQHWSKTVRVASDKRIPSTHNRSHPRSNLASPAHNRSQRGGPVCFTHTWSRPTQRPRWSYAWTPDGGCGFDGENKFALTHNRSHPSAHTWSQSSHCRRRSDPVWSEPPVVVLPLKRSPIAPLRWCDQISTVDKQPGAASRRCLNGAAPAPNPRRPGAAHRSLTLAAAPE